MNKHLPAAALALLLCGVAAPVPAGTPQQDARAEYEALTQPYLEAYRAFLKARLTGAPDLDARRQTYESAYATYLEALRSRGQTASTTQPPEPSGATMSPRIATPPTALSTSASAIASALPTLEPDSATVASSGSPVVGTKAPIPGSPEVASGVWTGVSSGLSTGEAGIGSGTAPTP